MITIRPSRPDEGPRAVEIWRHAVDATHDFLSPEDRRAIDALVCGFLPAAPLWLAVDANDVASAFMLIDDGHMEALFVDPACRGTGVGAALVRHGLALHPHLTPTSTNRTRRPSASTKRWVSRAPAAPSSTARGGPIR